MSTPDGPPLDLGQLGEVVDRHGADYLIVGGVAALGYGAQRLADDAEGVVRRDQLILGRLSGAL